jgi:hypothetical protein
MLAQLLICICFFLFLVWHSRLGGVSLGLPIAYLFSMLLQHLPGGIAHLVGGYFFADSLPTQIGLRFTTIGTVSFVAGVVLAQRFIGVRRGKSDTRGRHHGGTSRFAVFCLVGGWCTVCAAALIHGIPSLGAAVDQAGAVWMLGVLIGLLGAVRQRRHGRILLWLAALSVYPLAVLVNGGFLSFGSTSVFVVMSALLVRLKSQIRAYTGVALFSLFCFLGFLSYFQNRNAIREVTWGGGGLEQRLARSASIITDIRWFDSHNTDQLTALDERLNQNSFAGMAAQRIESGQTVFLHGRSVWEGLQALVPRVLWPDKPIFAGSSQLIREMTGFEVNENTSYGVGQVMEFYINFGVPSLVVGFLLFGFAYGWIDKNAAAALQAGEFGRAFIWFLPGIGMNAPLSSLAEVMGNIAAALVAAYGWRYAWVMLGAKYLPRAGQARLLEVAKRTDGFVSANSKQTP